MRDLLTNRSNRFCRRTNTAHIYEETRITRPVRGAASSPALAVKLGLIGLQDARREAF